MDTQSHRGVRNAACNPHCPLAKLCTVPNPMETEQAFRRFYHKDLDSLGLPQLRAEHERARLALFLEDDSPDPWLVARFEAVEEAIRHATP